MTAVEIEYCVPCGHLDRAIEVQRALLSTLGEQLDAVTLRTGRNGVFRVTVDDDVIDDTGEMFDIDDIVREVRKQV
jgi:selenoprotein W-related protein